MTRTHSGERHTFLYLTFHSTNRGAQVGKVRAVSSESTSTKGKSAQNKEHKQGNRGGEGRARGARDSGEGGGGGGEGRRAGAAAAGPLLAAALPRRPSPARAGLPRLGHLISLRCRQPAAGNYGSGGGRRLRTQGRLSLKATQPSRRADFFRTDGSTGTHGVPPRGLPELRAAGLWDRVQTPWPATEGPSEGAAPTPPTGTARGPPTPHPCKQVRCPPGRPPYCPPATSHSKPALRSHRAAPPPPTRSAPPSKEAGGLSTPHHGAGAATASQGPQLSSSSNGSGIPT